MAASEVAYVHRNEAPPSVSAGSDTLIPWKPKRSPRPPATSTNTEDRSNAAPALSSSRKASEPMRMRSPSGTPTAKPSNGLLSAAESASSRRA
eukprot:scaffold9451_cov103-Isochrysis_galbana.AAC.4